MADNVTNQKTILITRPAEDADGLQHKLEARGYAVISSPVIEINYTRPSPAPTEATMPQETSTDPAKQISANDVYAFTSANGVRAAAHYHLPKRHAFAVGPATYNCCQEFGFEASQAEGDVAALAGLIAASAQQGLISDEAVIWHIAGRDKAGDLIGALTQKGLMAQALNLYQAQASAGFTPSALAALVQNDISAVMLYSKRSAQIFFDLVEAQNLMENLRQQDLAFLCLSPNVAEICRDAGFRQLYVAPTPDEEALLNCLDVLS